MNAKAVNHLNTFGKEEVLSQVAPNDKEYLNANAVNHLNTFGKEEDLGQVAPKDLEYFNAKAAYHLNTFGKEEVLGQVAPKGGKAARLVQRVPAHESGHPGGAIHAQKVGRQVDTRVARTKVYLESNQFITG